MDTHSWLVNKFGDEVVNLELVAKELLGKTERQFTRIGEKAGTPPPWPYFKLARSAPRMCRMRDVAQALDSQADQAARELQAVQ